MTFNQREKILARTNIIMLVVLFILIIYSIEV